MPHSSLKVNSRFDPYSYFLFLFLFAYSAGGEVLIGAARTVFPTASVFAPISSRFCAKGACNYNDTNLG